MDEKRQKAIVCSCEDTMTLDAGAIRRGCPNLDIATARQLCRAEIDTFRRAAKDGNLTVACTQEQPLFEAVAEDANLGAALTFVNVRETAGWAAEGADAGAKMAALLAAAQVADSEASYVTLESEGVALIFGRDEVAIEAARALEDKLDITVLLDGSTAVAPPRRTEFPIRRGTVRQAKGHLGAFDLVIDGLAEPAPSSRDELKFGPTRDGAKSSTDIIIDLSGRPPLFSTHHLREGYLRADPADPVAVQKLILKGRELVGTFDKPRYVALDADLCAHARSRIVGCTRCLDLCPAGAIAPAGEHVVIDDHICGGCGACSAACPTGAVTYAYPTVERLIERVRVLVSTFHAAGGRAPALLFHDAEHGDDLIDAAARYSRGLPAHVLPVRVNEVTEVGLETVAAAFAYGAAHVRFLVRAKPRHDLSGLRQTVELAGRTLSALGYGETAVATIETDDPDALIKVLGAMGPTKTAKVPAAFQPVGGKREILAMALRELHRVAPTPVDVVPLPERAPFGTVRVRTDGCTLCLACVSACPTSALGDAEDRPLLSFTESLCVQCGLCKATCPEKVISLEPRIRFKAFDEGPIVVKEEEPFCCVRCGKPFGTKSTVERVLAKLEDKHWMFTGEGKSRLDLIKMCDDCRVVVVTGEGMDPYAAAPRPLPRTTEDYLRERERQMLEKIDKGEA